MKKEKVKKDYSLFSLLRHLIPSVIKAAPLLFIILVTVSLIHTLGWGIDAYIKQYFFDSAMGLTTGDKIMRNVLFAFALLAAHAVGIQLLNGISNYQYTVLDKTVMQKLRRDVNRKIGNLSPELFEQTDTLDDINKAENGLGASIDFFLTMMSITVFYIPYFAVMGWYLFSLKPVLAFSILIVFIPSALSQLIRVKIFAKLEDESAPLRREYEYYEKCITDREYFKETRLLGGFRFFKNLFVGTFNLSQKLKMKANIRTTLFEFSMNIVTIIGYFIILYMLFTALMNGEVTVGAFASVYASIGMLYAIMNEVIQMHIGRLTGRFGSVANYARFIKLPERHGEIKDAPEWGDITFENVSYSYPGTDSPALHDISFTLHRGETLAVVGENGSGKSTLVRLLSGLYFPSEGRVLHNGMDVREIEPDAIYENTSAVFQKYQRYQMTLGENMTISESGKTADETQLDNLSSMAGNNTSDPVFKDGYNTMLSREFDGVDLSGGQWQRIAIARGFYRDHNLIILDEPTAAIDPFEETRIYNRFAEISRDKSAVIVTHRIGSVKLADRILVLCGGKMVQLGTHDDLINKDGEYQRLYKAQEQWYRA